METEEVYGACRAIWGELDRSEIIYRKARPQGKSRYIYMMDLVEIEWDGVDWIGLAQDMCRWIALEKAVMNNLVL
jgi:hypothetical protein